MNLDEDGAMMWKSWLATFHESSGAKYTVGQLERGEATHHPHIQFYINFKIGRRLAFIKKLDQRVHAEPCKSEQASIDYCQKQETRVEGPLEFGEPPFHANKKEDWDKIWEAAKQGDLESIPATIRTIHYKTLKAIAKDHMIFKDSDHLRGIWIWGEAGSGKSRWVRQQALEMGYGLYPKLCNKWWDGYQNEKLVVMDDLGPNHECLAQQIKIWTDRYDCILETKGGAVHSSYEWFIITSQYSPEEIFKDEKDLAAIKRRCQVYKIKDVLGLKLNIKALNSIYLNNSN
jgi:hypothetical protein